MAAPGRTASLPTLARPGGNDRTGDAVLVLLLSLFLLLLVFFIVLNAHTVRDGRRTGAVLASVDRSFPVFFVDPRLREGDGPLASRSGTVTAAERLTGVGDLFASELALAKVEVVRPGRLMEVRLPADGLFLPGTATVRPERQGLIDRVVSALREEFPGERVELEALLAIGPGAPSQPPGPVQRAAALARHLLADGAPPAAVGVGVERGPPGSARFLFSIRGNDAGGGAGGGPGDLR